MSRTLRYVTEDTRELIAEIELSDEEYALHKAAARKAKLRLPDWFLSLIEQALEVSEATN